MSLMDVAPSLKPLLLMSSSLFCQLSISLVVSLKASVLGFRFSNLSPRILTLSLMPLMVYACVSNPTIDSLSFHLDKDASTSL
nr:MAG TPA: hypothetical protein [Caudoviricetes sp.]